jgi:hypothetical protein
MAPLVHGVPLSVVLFTGRRVLQARRFRPEPVVYHGAFIAG